jgi:hypothetical protein
MTLEEAIEKERLKGIGLLTTVIVLIVIVFFLIPPRFLGTTMIPEIVATCTILLALQAVNRRLITCRKFYGFEAFKRKEFEGVIEALGPFLGRWLLWPNARFDKSGEVLYMLTIAFIASDELPKARQITAYLTKYRANDWAQKAQNALDQATRKSAD